MFPPCLVEHVSELNAIPLGMGRVLSLALSVLRMAAAPRGEGLPDDRGICGQAPRLLDWHVKGFGDDGFDAVHTPIKVVGG
jgi:hypothetical protein